MKNKINSEIAPTYNKNQNNDNDIIKQALGILHSRMKTPDFYVTSPHDVRDYLKLKLSAEEREIFSVMFLDNRHGLIEYKELFFGTIDGAAVYPREVVKAALKLNAAAIIIAHNHPSGISDPSTADENITIRLQKALALVDIRLLDHLIVGNDSITSLAEKGVL